MTCSSQGGPRPPRTARRLIGLLIGLMVPCGCQAPAPRFTPQEAPEEAWALFEARFLKNVRQLTSPDMGLDKSGEAYFSPDGRAIVFQAYPRGESDYQIYTLQLTESGTAIPWSLKRISPEGGACTCAYFHPDGTRLLFASTYLNPTTADTKPLYQRAGSTYQWDKPDGMDIFETDLDGGDIRRLTETNGYDAEGSYSPDGSKIVFTSMRDGDAEIYVMNADGSAPRRLTSAAGYDGGPFFSPDGRRIILRSDRRQNDLLQLFVMNADGSGERPLTDTAFVNWGPYWHPTGRSVAFATSAHGHQNYEVYLMGVDSGRSQRLTFRPGFDGLPVFSPDGRQMMWTSKRGPDGTSQIFAADFALPDGF